MLLVLGEGLEMMSVACVVDISSLTDCSWISRSNFPSFLIFDSWGTFADVLVWRYGSYVEGKDFSTKRPSVA